MEAMSASAMCAHFTVVFFIMVLDDLSLYIQTKILNFNFSTHAYLWERFYKNI